MLRKNRQEIVEGFQEHLSKGKLLVGVGSGMEQIAKHGDKSGADFLVFYHTGHLQSAGRSLLAGILSYDDANTCLQESSNEVLYTMRKIPVLAGVCGTDPFRKMDMFLGELKERGFHGVQNFPTVGIVDGRFRANLEGTGIGYQLEVDMIRAAHELDLFTCPIVFDAEQGEAMTMAGADMLLVHFGLVTKGAKARGEVPSLEDCCEKLRQIMEKSNAIRRHIPILCYGIQVSSLEGAMQVIQRLPSLAGFFTVFPGNVEDSERDMTGRIKEYRTLDKLKKAAHRLRIAE
ncbi:MAG: phosphoenolpyruvate hydrolase family protein [Selenomonas sp.]|uniref:phosphoenolpyruvate hydrolase family protein n=1 Tax=Selenomonas sp. TaxID=2053611 RepID=UPI0025F7F420|nr:phosphoenolpyruvate hydrolase family protein [Selenomonas sp.]MCR5758479.1 phosphoenolpyruvate hydrolase family protein [Selenomonas sp.]